MKSAWFEDLLSLIPPISFLVVNRIRRRGRTRDYPYGYHRAVTVGFLISAFALTTMGAYLLWDGGSKLLKMEHTTIGTMQLFGHQIWQGWPMIAVMLYASIPIVIIGRAKRKPAERIHDKVLYADADMNSADWQTGFAAIVGILGVGAGLWWADAAAALFISFGVMKDGVTNLRAAVGDIMDSRPRKVDHSGELGIIEALENKLCDLDWVKKARVRLRDNGHVFFGEAQIVPKDGKASLEREKEAEEVLYDHDWRIEHLAVTLISEDRYGDRFRSD